MKQQTRTISDDEKQHIKHAATRGAIQTMFAKYFSTGIGFAFGVLMARILAPEDFGLMALATFFIGLSARLRQLCLDEVLIQKQGDEEEAYSTHFSMQLLLGLLQIVLVLAAVPLLNHFYPDARVQNATLISLLLVLLAGELVSQIASTPLTILRKTMQFRHLAYIEGGGSVAALAIGAFLALNGFGVWGLAAGRMAPSVFVAAYCLITRPWKPSLKLNNQIARSFLRFGFYLWLIQVTMFVTYAIGNLLVGSMIGIAALGFYSKALNLAILPLDKLTEMFATVSYPVYCRLQNNREDISKALSRVLGTIFRLTVPVSLGMILVGEEFIEILYGEKWLPAAHYLKILAVYSLFRSIFDDTGRIFLAVGRPKIPAALRLVQSVLQIAVSYLLVWRFGAVGAALGVNFAVVSGVLLNSVFLNRVVTIQFRRILFHPLLSGTITLLTVIGIEKTVGSFGLYSGFLIKGSLCVVLYFAVLIALAREQLLHEMIDLRMSFAARRSRT